MYKIPPPPSTGVIGPSGELIPPDERNKHWRKYLAWVATGNTAAPYVEPVDVTVERTRQQRERTDGEGLREDGKFQNLIERTPSQIRTWVENNFPSLTLAEQRDLATIVSAVSVIARKI